MTIAMSLDQVLHLAPNARSAYREAFGNGQPVLDRHGISASPLRLAHFVAQVLHESCGLTVQYENLNYSAGRLAKVWPGRFRPNGPLDPGLYANDPCRLAAVVYGGRMGNDAAGDGYTYRGRGLLQLTGRDSYAQATRCLRRLDPSAPDLEAAPDAVLSARWCLQIAASQWEERGCNPLADQDSVRRVTQAINGGLVGLAEREEWTRRTRAVWCQAGPAPRVLASPL